MPVLDFICNECNNEFEYIVFANTESENKMIVCSKCGHTNISQLCPQESPKFKLKYNNKTDMCDWDGNVSRYWDKYNDMKKNGEKPRIPALDGDG